MIYLFVGEDEFSKDIKLQKIKQEFFPPQLESFNFETLYSKDLDLKTLKTRLFQLPINPALARKDGIKARQRLILIKNATELRPEIKEYLFTFLKNPPSHISIILEARRIDRRDQFLNQISNIVKLIKFRQSEEINAFSLAEQIIHKKAKPAMRMLRRLLLQGEKPERILGALRYRLHKERLDIRDKKRKLMFLLNCDIDIKTGRLKPDFALERLLIRFCYF
jgi:DNA polymerase III delta subunit